MFVEVGRRGQVKIGLREARRVDKLVEEDAYLLPALDVQNGVTVHDYGVFEAIAHGGDGRCA